MVSLHCTFSKGSPAPGSTMILWVSRTTRVAGSGMMIWLFAAFCDGGKTRGAVRS